MINYGVLKFTIMSLQKIECEKLTLANWNKTNDTYKEDEKKQQRTLTFTIMKMLKTKLA